jgi:hypothetical protein
MQSFLHHFSHLILVKNQYSFYSRRTLGVAVDSFFCPVFIQAKAGDSANEREGKTAVS